MAVIDGHRDPRAEDEDAAGSWPSFGRAAQTSQLRAQFGGGLVAQLAIFLERAVDDALELRRHPELSRTGAAGASCRTASSVATDEGRRNGGCPVTISYSTTPSEKMSVRASSGSPRTCSGDMYATVPMTIPGCVAGCSSGRGRGRILGESGR